MTYIAKLVFEIEQANNKGAKQFDEQLRLIIADNKGSAFEQALQIGKDEEDQPTDDEAANKKANWKFIGISDLFPLQKMESGAPVYSFTTEHCEPESYINFVLLRTNNFGMTAESN